MCRMSGIKVERGQTGDAELLRRLPPAERPARRLAQLPEALARPGAGQRHRQQRAQHASTATRSGPRWRACSRPRPSGWPTRIASEHVQMQAVFLAFLPPALAGQSSRPCREGRELVLLNLARLDEIDRDLLIRTGRAGRALPGRARHAERQRRRRAPGRRDPEPPAGTTAPAWSSCCARTTPRWCRRSNCRCTTSSSCRARPSRRITRLLDEIPLEQWAIALKGAEPALRDAILTRDATPPGAELRGPDAPLRPGADVAHRADPQGDHGHRQGNWPTPARSRSSCSPRPLAE